MKESTSPSLVFGVAIEKLDQKLNIWKQQIKDFANNGGKGYKLKIDFGEAEAFIKTLKNLKVGDTSEIERMQKEIDSLKKTLKELNDGSGLKKVQENITKPLRRGSDETKKVAQDLEKSKKRISDAYNDMLKSINLLQLDKAKAKGLGIDVSGYTTVISQLKMFAAEMNRLNSHNSFHANKDAVASTMSQYNNYIEVIRMLRNEIASLTKSESEHSKQESKQKLIDTRSVNEAIYQISILEKRIASLKALQAEANGLGINTPNLDKLLEDMDRYMQKFKAIFDNGGHLTDGTTAQMIKTEGDYRALNQRIQQNTQETRVNIAARNSAVATLSHLAGEEMRLAQAINSTTTSLHGQSQALQDLKSMTAQYISLWGAKSFFDNIIEKGGQLEQQRLSIGAILGDTAHATDLFSKVKSLAIKSPFGVTELDQMTKQLSAYGFEYSELYDLSKRLADISAATGTEVSRLGLALGHVKSEAALTGYTLRQFSMANVPLLAKLAEKLGVTTSQVRKMVSKKEIGYDQVLEVLQDLTNREGAFFEAQETMSEALNAKFKNLRDSYEIMFSEIAESKMGDSLKGLASVLTDISRHWQELFAIIGSGIAAYGAMKAYMALVNSLLGENATAVTRNMRAYQVAEATNLRLARSYRNLSFEESALTTATKKWTLSERMAHTWIGKRLGLTKELDIYQKHRISTTRQQIIYGNALALTERKLTTEDVARSVALGKLSKAQARQAIHLSDISLAEKKAGIAAVNSVRTYGAMTGVVNGASMAFSKLGTALKSMFLNPQMAVLALLAGIMEMWQRNKIEVDRAKRLNDDLFNRAMEGIKNIRSMMETTGISLKINGVEVELGNVSDIINGKFTYKPSGEMSTEGMMAQIDKWTQFIKEYAATPNSILNNAFKDEAGNVRTVAEQYEILAKSVTDTAKAYVYLKDVSSAAEYAENATNGGWLDDDLISNINDYSNYVKKYDDSISKLVSNHSQSIETALQAARSESVFASSLKSANAEMFKNENRNLTQAEQLKMLVENQDKYTDAVKAFEEARKSLNVEEEKALSHVFHGSGVGIFGAEGPDKLAWQMQEAYNKMDADANTWATQLKAKLSEVGWDFNNLSEAQKMAIALAITEMVNKADDATEDIREKVKELANEKFGISLDVRTLTAAAKINALEQSLKDLVGHDWHIDIKAATNFNDVINKIRQDYKSAQDYFNDVKPLLVKMGVDVSGGMKELGQMKQTELINQWEKENPGKDSTFIANMLAEYDSFAKKLNDAMDFNTTTGISLSDPNSGGKTFRDKDQSNTDKELELWRKRIQVLEKYNQEIEQLEKIMTRTQAEAKLKNEGNFSSLWEYFTNPNDYIGSLSEVEKILGINGDRKNFVDELGAKKSSESLRVFKDDVSSAVSELDRMAKIMAENYDTYKKWLDLTGDAKFAAKVAGVSENTSMADWLKEQMNGELIKAGTKLSATDIFNMNESDAREFGENSSIFKIWNEWQDNNSKIKKQNLDLYEEAIKNAKGYSEKVADINRELNKEIEAIKAMTGGNAPTESQQTQRNALIKNAKETATKKIADESWNNFKATEEWGRIFADLDRISTGTLERMLEKLRGIAPALNGSVESTKAVYEAIEKVTNILNGRNPLKAIGNSIKNRNVLTGYYKQAKKEGALVANQELSNLLGVKLGSVVTENQIEDGLKNEKKNLKESITEVIDSLQTFQNGLNLVSNVFDSLGIEGAANFASDASSILGGAISGASSLSALGPWGMAAGAGLGLISGIAQAHDNRLERKIEALRSDVQSIEANAEVIAQARQRTLGYDNGNIRKSYASQYSPSNAIADIYRNIWLSPDYLKQGFKSESEKAMYDFYMKNSGGNGYQQQLKNLKAEREDYMKMYDLEADKKKSSKEALEEYKSKIAELDDQIRNFSEDISKELWGIDLKGWSDQISDALMNAFENGEDAAKAFKATVQDIMSKVLRNMLSLGIIQPMMEKLQMKLFGENGQGGSFNALNPEGTIDAAMRDVAAFFGEGGEGQMMIHSAQMFYDKWEDFAKSKGLTLNTGSYDSSGLSKSVQSVTEKTADLLSSYANSMRADLSINKGMIAEYFPMYYAAMTSGNESLRNIENHTAAIMRSNDAIAENTHLVERLLRNAVDGSGRMRIA